MSLLFFHFPGQHIGITCRFTDTVDVYNQHGFSINDHQRLLQRFYSQLNNLTREVLFIQERTPVFGLTPVRAVLSRLQNGQSINYIGDWRDVSLFIINYFISYSSNKSNKIKRMTYRVPLLDKQMVSINCSKCIKLDWVKMWCGLDNFCRSADYRSGLVYFSDGHHVSPLGSLYQGSEMRRAYDSFMKSSKV